MRLTYAILLTAIAVNMTWSNITDHLRWQESGKHKAAILKDLKFAGLSEEAARHVGIQYTNQEMVFKFEGMNVFPAFYDGD